MAQQGVSKPVRKATRWSRNGRGLFTAKDKDSTETTAPPSHDDESHDTLCRENLGIPNWENPLAMTMPVTDMPNTAMPNTEMPNTQMPNTEMPNTELRRVPQSRPSPRPRRVSSKASLQEIVSQTRQKEHSPLRPKKAPVPDRIPYDDDQFPRSFENMIIECNDSNASLGDITYDESVFYDDEYIRNQRAQHQHPHHSRPNDRRFSRYNDPPRHHEHLPRHYENPPRNAEHSPRNAEQSPRRAEHSPRSDNFHRRPDGSSRFAENHLRQADASPRAPRCQRSRSYDDVSPHVGMDPSRSRSRSSDDMRCSAPPLDDLEMKERQLLDLALERSLQEANSQTYDRQLNNATNHSNYSGTGRSGSTTQSPFAEAGCHLAMLGSQRPPRIRGSRSSGEGSSPPFVWKREGKTWMKVPVQGRGGGSHAGMQQSGSQYGDYSREGNYVNDQNSRSSRSAARENPSVSCSRLAGIPQDRLDRMEQEMIEEALQLSVQGSNNSNLPAKVSPRFENDRYFQPPRGTSSCGSASIELGDEELSQAYQEKEMLELALQRSIHDQSMTNSCTSGSNSHVSGNSFYSNRSYEPKQAPCPEPLPATMLGRFDSVRGGFGIRDDEEDELLYERQQGDSAGTTSTGQRLVWKKGPNGRWGKFPENSGQGNPPPRRSTYHGMSSSGRQNCHASPSSRRSLSASDDEERLVQEALERSMEEAMRRSLIER